MSQPATDESTFSQNELLVFETLLAQNPLRHLSPQIELPDPSELSAIWQTIHEDLNCNWRKSMSCGLWLLLGEWEKAHEVSQDLNSPEGAYWHGIAHRIERDFWNAKYWFRQLGGHPVSDTLLDFVQHTTHGSTMPWSELNTWYFGSWIDWYESAKSPELMKIADAIATAEWRFLMRYSVKQIRASQGSKS
ncbi:MAG: hypothetical protein R3C03_15735 [Pirellulaceae bacterium]